MAFLGTCPDKTIKGVLSLLASVIGVTRLVKPGPEVTIQTPGFPVDLA